MEYNMISEKRNENLNNCKRNSRGEEKVEYERVNYLEARRNRKKIGKKSEYNKYIGGWFHAN